MKYFSDTNRLHHLLGWTLFGLLLVLLALEGWRYGIKPSETNNEYVIEKSLERASAFFADKQRELLTRTENLGATLEPALMQKRPRSYLNNILEEFPEFWGIALYQQNSPLIWKGFALEGPTGEQLKNPLEPSLTIRKYNNVIYWESHVPIRFQDSSETVTYSLYTKYRLEQSNLLPIGDRSEFNILRSSEFSSEYPVNFSIFSKPSGNIVNRTALTNLAGDSVGVAYATAEEFQQTREKWQQNTRFWRSVYVIFCFIILVVILFGAVDNLPVLVSLLIQLLFIGIGWGIFAYTNWISYWILALTNATDSDWMNMVEYFTSLCTEAFFLLLISITISRKLNDLKWRMDANWYLSIITIATLAGIINAVSIPLVFDYIYHPVSASSVALMDLKIFPSWSTLVLYLALGTFLLAVGILLITLNRVLFRISAEHAKLAASVLGAAFFISLFFTQLYIPDQMVLNWIFYTSIISFLLILGISFSYFKKFIGIAASSPLRKIVIGSLALSLAGIPILYQAYLDNLDQELWKTATDYAKEEDPFAAKLTRQLLINLEEEFRGISADSLQENRSSLQSRFTQTIQNFLSPRWNAYSFNLQLINPEGTLIADYATDLNSPDWITIYNIATLESTTEIEQITKSTIRPIVQLPQLINPQRYRTFYRGWIPVFGDSPQTPVAWILCSIYQERPQFDKPIRAVMASLTYEDWNKSFLMQKYKNGRLISTAKQGFAGYFPKFQNLDSQQLESFGKDSLLYVTNSGPEYAYRTLMWKNSEETIFKISTTIAGYRTLLFSFFRFSLTLLLLGSLVTLIGQLLTWGKVKFLGKKKRFQDRILDSFLLAILIFLAFLIVTSHYAIKQQNQDIVRQELFDKLESLSEAIESNRAIQNNEDVGSEFSLDSLSTSLNADATFYANRTVTETTTPQIYQQHLLPSALPYEIFEQLYLQQQRDAMSTVNLAGQSLLIGYRSILNRENLPVATIAIPTFLESPKYDQQLLETTSYLILIYLLVFGLFTIGSAVIAKKLTRPLEYIQEGLNKISAGNLNTTIPVASQDEIGKLARAYNKMVFRLKKLQKDLASAEREAAWKEMAQQVAHEIKNPLTPMKLNVQHLERQLKSDKYEPEELKKSIEKITANLIEQIQSLSNIAADFSKFSQPVEKDFSRVNLSSILSSVAELYEHDEKIEINYSPNSAVFVAGISDELKRVVINLVKNAYEAMPEGGKIQLRLYRKYNNAFIEVEDNGSGIQEEDRPNIFVPNFSTKSSGTGLGLAICKKIIEAHEGSITFASVEGEGTTFVIKLPLY